MADQKQTAAKHQSIKDRGKICKCWKVISILLILIPILISAYLASRFLPDRAVSYTAIEEHFKYGSTGGERNLGIPYWIWRAAPHICSEMLPDKKRDDIGFESLGMIYEEGKTLPVGVSTRRHLGLDRVFLNCAACHSSTIRKTAEDKPEIILGMPASRLNFMGFEKFFFQCVTSEKFNRNYLIPEIDRLGADLDFIDRYLVYPLAIWLTQERLQLLASRLSFVYRQPDWGPGRVDTFNAAKAIFNWDWNKASAREMIGTTDFPSIWNQRQRKHRDDGEPMELHWDGNNDKVEERNLSAAFGTGATPPIADHKAIGRIEDWLLVHQPLAYPFAINQKLATQGGAIYKEYCAACHGASGTDFSGAKVGYVEEIDSIGTDRWRLDSYTAELAANQATLYTGDEKYRFKRFRKTNGYANLPLDGIWLRAPYLHNGSVPTLRDLLEPSDERPEVFYRGNDVLDSWNVGFVTDVAEENGRKYFRFDTSIAGNSNKGHEGAAYGTELPAAQKKALIEYLKTF